MSRELDRRLRALEGRPVERQPGWDSSQLTDAELTELIDLQMTDLYGAGLDDAQRCRHAHLQSLIERRGPPPFQHLTDAELKARLAPLVADYQAGQAG